MFVFHSAKGGIPVTYLLMWFLVFASLFLLNEVSRRYKMIGLLFFFVMPALLSVLWFTVLKKSTYTDWFHLAKVYSATAGCIGFWLIRHYKKTRKDKTVFHLCDSRIALCFPPLILAINIMEAVTRDIEVGMTYRTMAQDATADVSVLLMGGPWNFMNAAAGVLNIITITGWFGICLRKVTEKDKSKDMLGLICSGSGSQPMIYGTLLIPITVCLTMPGTAVWHFYWHPLFAHLRWEREHGFSIVPRLWHFGVCSPRPSQDFRMWDNSGWTHLISQVSTLQSA